MGPSQFPVILCPHPDEHYLEMPRTYSAIDKIRTRLDEMQIQTSSAVVAFGAAEELDTSRLFRLR